MIERTSHDVEWFIPDPTSPVRQGDVLINRLPGADRIEETCIVITADCDISKGKFGRHLACLRVVRLHDYIKTTWASKKLTKARKDETEKVRSQVAKWHTKLLDSESKLTLDGTVSWIRRESPIDLCNALCVPDDERGKFVICIKALRDAFIAVDKVAHREELSQLVQFRAVIQNFPIEQVYQKTLQQAQQEPLPDDTFFLPGLPQLEDIPVVVLLREIVGVPHEAVHYRATDAWSDGSFLRIGRLQPMFKYAISQAFGTLYARIGLSQDYETRCRCAIDNIGTLPWDPS
ncbi:hypothetical protein [Ralstonia solanacearum]|uniref:hypothetical protein n=1 Tax=Ralstonia solanacearum TaxID=305 RepID=UPI000A8BA36A|nr:hypothetical protein [Ralstonia solanacearum]